jgi:hypothetical protein
MTPSPDTAPTAGGLPTVLEVADVIDLTASMRRIRFAGTGVAAYLRAPRIPNIKLLEAALGLALPDPLKEDFIWVSAESRVVRAVRRHVRMLGVPRENQLIIGYWHRGITETAYGRQSCNDRVPDESLVVLPENGKLRADSLERLFAGDAESHLAESRD